MSDLILLYKLTLNCLDLLNLILSTPTMENNQQQPESDSSKAEKARGFRFSAADKAFLIGERSAVAPLRL